SLLLVVRKLDRAAWLVQQGLDRSPNNPTLHTYKGIIVEMSGPVQTTVVARGRGLDLNPRAEKALEPATQEFRLALKADSHFALAARSDSLSRGRHPRARRSRAGARRRH